MYFLYTLVLTLSVPFLLLRLYWKGRRLPAYRLRIAERFFLQKTKPEPVDVWIHAVSLGEVVAVTPLVAILLSKGKKVLFTTMTPTGSQQVTARFKNTVYHQYIPYDLPWILRRFLKKIQPSCCVVMETELWPNLIKEVHAQGIALILANARISDRSWQQYRKLRFFFKPLLNCFESILAQSSHDAERFIMLGAPKERVHALGNIKFDMPVPERIDAKFHALCSLWGEDRVAVIAASTHDNEEQQFLEQLPVLQAAIPDMVLLISPRHPERFQSVYELSQSLGYKTGLRSIPATLSPDVEVVILDSIGELLKFYQMSSIAFVGGSLVPIGGHNVLEPISLSVPVVCGNYIHNSKAVCEALLSASGLKCLDSIQDVIQAIIFLHHNPEKCQQQTKNALDILRNNQGALTKTLSYIFKA